MGLSVEKSFQLNKEVIEIKFLNVISNSMNIKVLDICLMKHCNYYCYCESNETWDTSTNKN